MSADNSRRPIIFGEVLFDRFPDGSVVLGGAPFNVAWHLQAFGQAPMFISRVGDDPLGRRIRDAMLDWDMDTAGLQLDSAHPTGTVEVSFEDGEPHYDIVDGRAYDYVEADALPPLAGAALVYHGSLALRGEVTRRAFLELTARVPAPRFLDVNLRAPWWEQQGVLNLIQGAHWIKLSKQELVLLDPKGDCGAEAGKALRQRHGLQALILTRGEQGARLFGPETSLKVKPEPAKRVVDTVGAGDAFASVILLGLLKHWPMRTTLERAQTFASAMVGVRGATVQNADFYAHFAAVWGV